MYAFTDRLRHVGEVVRLNVLGDELLCLNNHEDAEELVRYLAHIYAMLYLTSLYSA
jgi:hypothetical protein